MDCYSLTSLAVFENMLHSQSKPVSVTNKASTGIHPDPGFTSLRPAQASSKAEFTSAISDWKSIHGPPTSTFQQEAQGSDALHSLDALFSAVTGTTLNDGADVFSFDGSFALTWPEYVCGPQSALTMFRWPKDLPSAETVNVSAIKL